MSKLKKDNHICGFCKHYDSDNCYCMASGMHEIYEEDTCEYWEGEKDEPDFDLECHDKKCENHK